MRKDRIVPDVFKTLGENIKRVRLLENLSQEQLAESIGKSSHLISLLEGGNCGVSVTTLIDICKALDVDANVIFSGVIPACEISSDNLLVKSFDSFDEKDKSMVSYLINYINSKN